MELPASRAVGTPMGSGALPWKLATVVCAAVAIGFATRSHSNARTDDPTADSSGDTQADAAESHTSSSFARSRSRRIVMGSRVDELVARMRRASGWQETCNVVARLGGTASPDAIEPLFSLVEHDRTTQIRTCAIDALRSVADRDVLTRIAELATDDDRDVRRHAFDVLAASGDADALAVVFDAARGTNPDLRIEAIVSLSDNRVPGALAEIVAALPSAEGSDRDELIVALGETGDPAATRALAGVLEASDTGWRGLVFDSLAHLGTPESVGMLRDALNSSDPREVSDAIAALGRAPRGLALPPLLAIAQDPASNQSMEAFRALSNCDDEEVRTLMRSSITNANPDTARLAMQYAAAHHDPDAVPLLVDLVRRGVLDVRTREAISTLASFGGDEARETLSGLATHPGPTQAPALEALRNVRGGERVAREIAYRTLDERGGAMDNALTILGDDPDPRARDLLAREAASHGGLSSSAMFYLARRRDAESLAAMRRFATSADRTVRHAALAALGQEGGPDAERSLTEALRDSNPETRAAAMTAIGELGGPILQRSFDDALRSDDPEMHASAARLIERQDLHVTPDQLTALARDPSRSTSYGALRRLATESPETALPIISARIDSAHGESYLLRDIAAAMPAEAQRQLFDRAFASSDADTRVFAIQGLVNFGGADVQQRLLAAVIDESAESSVRYAAANALNEIGGPFVDANREQLSHVFGEWGEVEGR